MLWDWMMLTAEIAKISINSDLNFTGDIVSGYSKSLHPNLGDLEKGGDGLSQSNGSAVNTSDNHKLRSVPFGAKSVTQVSFESSCNTSSDDAESSTAGLFHGTGVPKVCSNQDIYAQQ